MSEEVLSKEDDKKLHLEVEDEISEIEKRNDSAGSARPKKEAEDSKKDQKGVDEEEEEEEEEDHPVFVADLQNKNSFLMRVGVLFTIYTFFLTAACFYILVDVRRARVNYRALNVGGKILVALIISLALKLLVSFVPKMRSFAKVAFYLDIFFSTVLVFGMYFYFEEKFEKQYSFAGTIVIAASLMALSTSVGLTLSTLLGNNSYNPVVGVLLMALLNLLSILLVYLSIDSIMMKFSRMATLMGVFLIIDVYLAYNSLHLLAYRTKKFEEHETAYCFFTYWTDFMLNFWVEMAGELTKGKKKGSTAKKGKGKKVEDKKPNKNVEKETPKVKVDAKTKAEDHQDDSASVRKSDLVSGKEKDEEANPELST